MRDYQTNFCYVAIQIWHEGPGIVRISLVSTRSKLPYEPVFPFHSFAAQLINQSKDIPWHSQIRQIGDFQQKFDKITIVQAINYGSSKWHSLFVK